MSEFLDKLVSLGCDADGALRRFVNNEEMYRSFVHRVLDDPSFDALKKHLDEGNVEQAFESAHVIKGIVGNVGFTPMFVLVNAIVEPLRRGQMTGMKPLCDRLLVMRDSYREQFKDL